MWVVYASNADLWGSRIYLVPARINLSTLEKKMWEENFSSDTSGVIELGTGNLESVFE